MKINIGIYNRIGGNKTGQTMQVKLKQFRKLMHDQGWKLDHSHCPLSWVKGNYRAHAYFNVPPCLIDPCKMGCYSSGAQYE